MGETLKIEFITQNQEAMLSRLLIYYKRLPTLMRPQSVNKVLAERLLKCKPNRRSMKLSQIFNEVLDMYPDGVTIKDIDVMFNPDYQVDVLRILSEARKRKEYSVIWPGRCEDGKLIYGEEGYADYKVFTIDDYDITCVI